MPNATLKPANGRQYPLFAEVTIDVANMNESTVPVGAIKLPVGAQIVSGAVITETGFDAATATLAVGDSVLGTRYVSAANIAVAGRVALVPTGFIGNGEDVVVTPTFADPVTVGKVRVQVEYVIAGRAHEVQTN
jgi:hypothetical protein